MEGEFLNCWKYLLPIFWNSRRKNYAIETLNLLCQHKFTSSPHHRQRLLCARCINVHGIRGRNIPSDLHMEHLNRTIKTAMKALGSNKTDKAICRIGRALGTLAPVLDQFDLDNNVPSVTGSHKRSNTQRDVYTIVEELKKAKYLHISQPGSTTHSHIQETFCMEEKKKKSKNQTSKPTQNVIISYTNTLHLLAQQLHSHFLAHITAQTLITHVYMFVCFHVSKKDISMTFCVVVNVLL